MNTKSKSFILISIFVALGYILIISSILKSSPSKSVENESSKSVEIHALMNRYDELLAKYSEKEKENLNLVDQIKSLKFQPNNVKITEETALTSTTPTTSNPDHLPGVIVLGMHRSGTSMLSGLLTKLGLNTGEPLIPPNFDNEKGFFERIDVVNMNDVILASQNINYATNVAKFNYLKAIYDIMKAEIENNFDNKIQLIGADPEVTKDITKPKYQKTKYFQEGRFALRFLNNPDNSPWMLKDPRLCVTLKFWLSLLNRQPAIIFSYRHPFDVASSLNKREKMPFGHGLRLWYIYNRLALQNSQDLCRVIVSNKDLLTNTMSTMEKIKKGLRECGMALTEVADKFSEKDANEFIDLSLQHSHGSTEDLVCKNVMDKIDAIGGNDENDKKKRYFYSLEPFDSIELPSKWTQEEMTKHGVLYKESMRLYCALENGEAYLSDFPFNYEIYDTNLKY